MTTAWMSYRRIYSDGKTGMIFLLSKHVWQTWRHLENKESVSALDATHRLHIYNNAHFLYVLNIMFHKVSPH